MWLDHQQDIAQKLRLAGFRGDVTLHVPREVAKELVAWASAHDVTIEDYIDVWKIQTITDSLTVHYQLNETLFGCGVAFGPDNTEQQFPVAELLAYERAHQSCRPDGNDIPGPRRCVLLSTWLLWSGLQGGGMCRMRCS